MNKSGFRAKMMTIDHGHHGPQACVRQLLGNIPASSGPILVAVSGGSDSVGLLIALHEELSHHPRHTLIAVTVDHGLRQNSPHEASQVGALCANLGIAHHILEWRGEKPATGLQARARSERYRLMGVLAKEINAVLIVTGHNANDQLETILMRSARSAAGSLGLAGMAPAVLYDNCIWIVRPFLGISRQSIRDYLVGKNIGWVEDPTNEDAKYERARIRAQMPSSDIEQSQGFAYRQRLADTAADFLDHSLEVDRVGNIARIRLDEFQTDHDAHQLAVLSVIAMMGGCQHRLGRESAARVFDFLTSPFLASLAKRMTAGRCVLDRRRDGVYIYRENRSVPTRALDPGESVVWDGRYRITSRGEKPLAIGPNPNPSARIVEGFSPDAILRRASLVIPYVWRMECPSGADIDVLVETIVAPYATFLACSDLNLANALAKAINARRFIDFPPGSGPRLMTMLGGHQ